MVIQSRVPQSFQILKIWLHIKVHALCMQLVLCFRKLSSHCCFIAWSPACQRSVWSDVLIAVLTPGRAEEADWKVVSLRNNSGVPKCISRIVSLRFFSWAACHFSSGGWASKPNGSTPPDSDGMLFYSWDLSEPQTFSKLSMGINLYSHTTGTRCLVSLFPRR